jgi:hypothetical protein
MVNHNAIDIFTIGHFSVGVWPGQWFKPYECAIIGTLFEFTENWQKEVLPQFSPHPGKDKIQNSITDVIAVWAGAHVVRRGMKKEGLLTNDGIPIGDSVPFTRNTYIMILAKLGIYGGIVAYGMSRKGKKNIPRGRNI